MLMKFNNMPETPLETKRINRHAQAFREWF